MNGGISGGFKPGKLNSEIKILEVQQVSQIRLDKVLVFFII